MADQTEEILNKNAKAHALVLDSDVKQALENDKGPDANLNSFKVVDFTKLGDNYACFVTSVEVQYSLNGEDCNTTYVVKLNPGLSFESFEPMMTLMFVKEGSFYDKIVPEINEVLTAIGHTRLRVPRFYYASYEPKREMIFFEDLRKKDFKMFDRKKGIDKKHALLVFKELARLHSASKMLLERKGKDLISKCKLDDDIYKRMGEAGGTMDWFSSVPLNGAKMLEKCGGYSRAIEVLNEMGPQTLETILEQLKPVEPFSAICHGDCWNNNLLFRYEENEPVEVCLLDLQINRYSSVASDLRYFLVTSFNGDARQSCLGDFLSEYHSQFSQCMKAGNVAMPFTEQELHAEYLSKSKFGLLMGLMVIPAVLNEATEVKDYDGYTDADTEQLLAEGTETLVKMVETNPLFRPRLLALIDEMIEEGVLK